MNNITLAYNDALSVDFTTDAWFNATAVAKHFGKETNDWLMQRETVEYVVRLADLLSECKTCFVQEFNKIIELDSTSPASRSKLLKLAKQTGFVKTKSGPFEHGGGSWLHPKLAVPFSRWLDIGFSIWCDMQIENILHPVQHSLKQLPPSPYISESEAAQFKKSIEAHCGGNRKHYGSMYRKIYDYYGITSYKNIPTGKLEEAARLCGMKLLKLVKSKIPEEIQLLTFTREQLDALIAERLKAIEGEVMPNEVTNSITINLAPLVNKKSKRWLITQSCDEMAVLMSLGDDQEIMSREGFIRELRQDSNYIVFDKTGLSARQIVMHYIPPKFLPDMIEEAGAMLRRTEAGKL